MIQLYDPALLPLYNKSMSILDTYLKDLLTMKKVETIQDYYNAITLITDIYNEVDYQLYTLHKFPPIPEVMERINDTIEMTLNIEQSSTVTWPGKIKLGDYN